MADPIVRDMIAYFSVNYANNAIAWFSDVFRALESGTPLRMPAGKIVHCEIHIGDTPICLADAVDDGFGGSPDDLGGTPVRMPLNTKDATVAAAAKWLISQPIEDVSSEETQRRMDAMMQGGGG